MTPDQTTRAFSLTELLVVVAVILVLIAILIVGTQAIYANSVKLQCQHRLEQIGYALKMYAAQHRDMFPAAWDMHSGRLWYEALVATTLDDWEILACPASESGPPTPSGEGGFDTSARDHVDDLLEALRWLKDQQESTGRWKDTKGSYHTGVTGLALLAFLGFGCTDKYPPEFSQTVRKAAEYLCSEEVQQKDNTDDKQGWFKVHGYKYMYTQPICTMALCGVARMCQGSSLKQQAAHAAQLGFDFIADRQADEGSFGYYGPLDSYQGYWRGDTSLTAWALQAIAAARVAGLNPANTTWSEIDAKVDRYLQPGHCMDSLGRSSYWFNAANHASGGLAMTPLSLAARMLNGGKSSDAHAILQANYLMNGNRYINHAINRDGKNNYHLYYASLALYRMGGDYWTKWYKGGSGTPSGWEGYPKVVLKHKQDGGTDGEGNRTAFWEIDTCWPDACGNSAVSGTRAGGRVYTTCMAMLALEAAFEEHWIDESWTPTGGKCSYGYNNRLGTELRTPAPDTIMVMDYGNWEIDHDEIEVDRNDGPEMIATRHSGRANALMGDGRVRALHPDEISEAMFTLELDD